LHEQQYRPVANGPRGFTLVARNDTIREQADVAQLVEQLIRNQQVVSSSLTVGSRITVKSKTNGGATSRFREVILFCGVVALFQRRSRIPIVAKTARPTNAIARSPGTVKKNPMGQV
jgi:hypothetical protein